MASVTHGQFSFDGRTFNVTSSDGHIHRRASHAELRAVFDTSMPDRSNRPDYTNYWYEAQLLHYGLPTTKKKTTAKMRLLDALQDGTLTVPKETLKIEEDLKKAWEKQDLEARLRAADIQGYVDTHFTKTTVETKSATIRTATSEQAHRKRLGTPFCPKARKDSGMSSSSQSRKKRSSASIDQKNSKKSRIEQPATQYLPPTGQYHGTAGTNVNIHFNTQITTSDLQGSIASPTQRPTIIGHGSSKSEQLFPQVGHDTTPYSYEFDYDTSSFDMMSGLFDINNAFYTTQSSNSQTQSPKLGLINGEYDIFSSDFNDWPGMAPLQGFNLALCLDDNKTEIWGEYRFGALRGIMHMQNRPWISSQKQHPVEWRDRNFAGRKESGTLKEGWIRFLGDGEIEGEINFCGGLKFFEGQRVRGQGVRRPRDLYWLQAEWNRLGE